jgi:hypothetical protein
MSEGGWGPITNKAAVTVDGESLDAVDLVLLGVLTGEWPAFERQVALGLELEAAHPATIGDDEVRREATAFRYAHGLISAADFRGWLRARELTVVDVSAVLRRRLLRRDHPGSSGAPATEESVLRVLPAEALCDGVLARLADEGIDRLVAGQLVADVPPVEAQRLDRAIASAQEARTPFVAALSAADLQARMSQLLRLGLALDALRRDVAEPSAIRRRMVQHALEWTQLVGDELRFAREGAAREARLQMTADGDSVATVAERAEVPVLDRRLLVGEAPSALGVSFTAAAVGEVVGPWEDDGLWHVLQLRAKVPPSPEDASLSARAVDELLRERIDRHAAGRTARHAEL